MPTPEPFSPDTIRALEALAREKQVEDRIPGLASAVARAGEVRWWSGIGSADLDDPERGPDLDTQYSVASNTKSFVAVVVMALRDEGRLDLDDLLSTHVPGAGHERVTLRQLLSHTSGMQREPAGLSWETRRFPAAEELVENWNTIERVGRPHDRWHYSNIGFAMLGRVVERLDGGDWFASVRRRILEPLELRHTGLEFGANRAQPYYVPPYADVALAEPWIDLAATGAAGALVSTLRDLARWGGFFADPVAEVLSADSVEEMCQPQVLADTADWSAGYGLGLQIFRNGGHTWIGHTGGFPGFISAVMTHRPSGTTGVVLTNNSGATAPATYASTLGVRALELEPVVPEPWRPGKVVPAEFAALLGRWFSEGQPHLFSVRGGELESRMESAPAQEVSRFERIDEDSYRTISGPERGERLLIRRGDNGTVTSLIWAGYTFTREPLSFAGEGV